KYFSLTRSGCHRDQLPSLLSRRRPVGFIAVLTRRGGAVAFGATKLPVEQLLFEFLDLLDAALMAAALEGRLQPGLDDLHGHAIGEHIARQAEAVGIVMAAGQFGGDLVMAQRPTD